MNNRCGIAPDCEHSFASLFVCANDGPTVDTPEYARFSSVQSRSWETNEGIDP